MLLHVQMLDVPESWRAATAVATSGEAAWFSALAVPPATTRVSSAPLLGRMAVYDRPVVGIYHEGLTGSTSYDVDFR